MAMMVAVMMMVKWIPGNYYKNPAVISIAFATAREDFCVLAGKDPPSPLCFGGAKEKSNKGMLEGPPPAGSHHSTKAPESLIGTPLRMICPHVPGQNSIWGGSRQ